MKIQKNKFGAVTTYVQRWTSDSLKLISTLNTNIHELSLLRQQSDIVTISQLLAVQIFIHIAEGSRENSAGNCGAVTAYLQR